MKGLRGMLEADGTEAKEASHLEQDTKEIFGLGMCTKETRGMR
jgi:hypothetical protein